MKIKQILLYIHQLPQNIVGFLLTRKPKHTIDDFKLNDGTTTKVYFTKNVFDCGVSLGNYIILDDDVYYDNCLYRRKNAIKTVNHEHGHQFQSLYFGWFYLIFVGLISAVFNNLWDRIFHKKWDFEKRTKWYYNRYPEKWADKLGKVDRW